MNIKLSFQKNAEEHEKMILLQRCQNIERILTIKKVSIHFKKIDTCKNIQRPCRFCEQKRKCLPKAPFFTFIINDDKYVFSLEKKGGKNKADAWKDLIKDDIDAVYEKHDFLDSLDWLAGFYGPESAH